MSNPNLLAIWAKHERGEGSTNEELGHLIEQFESLQDGLEQAEENLESALEANKRWAHRSSRETSELRKAEAAVARVRESLSNHPRACEEHPENDAIKCGWKNAVIDVQNALDGDGRG